MPRKPRLALAAALLAVAAVSAIAGSASALNPGFGRTPTYYYGGFIFGSCC
jgi:hypothetical protein